MSSAATHRCRGLATSAAIGALVLLAPTAALAQEPFVPFDQCNGRTHDGGTTTDERDGTVTDGLSTEYDGVALPPDMLPPDAIFPGMEIAELFFVVISDGASGAQVGVGQFDDMGRAVADIPLFSFGEHERQAIQITDQSGSQVMDLPTDIFGGTATYIVDDTEPACSVDLLDAAEPSDVEDDPSPRMTDLESPTPTTVASPSVVPSEAAAADGDDGLDLWWAWVLGGLALILVGWAINRAAGDDDEDATGPTEPPRRDVGGTRVRKPVPELHTTPRDGGDDPRDVNSCDHAVYWNGPAGRVLVRKPRGVECCVYDVTVSTDWYRHDQARAVRQPTEDEIAAAGGDRLRMGEIDDVSGAILGECEVWTRSGPAGSLDWMQGLGDVDRTPVDYAEDTYWQNRPFEDRPEMAASFYDEADTTITVRLTSGCVQHQPFYDAQTESWASIYGDGECTNDGDPTCPVELNAIGSLNSYAVGDVESRAQVIAKGTVDELDAGMQSRLDDKGLPTADVLARRHLEEHSHPQAPRRHFETTDGSGPKRFNANLLKDTFHAVMGRALELHSSQIIPVHVWPATDRVSALVGGSANSRIELAGGSTNTACNEGNLCGHADACACSPEISMTICGAGFDVLTVEGRTIPIHYPGGPLTRGNWKIDQTNLPL